MPSDVLQRLFVEAPRPVRACELVVAGGIVVVTIGTAAGIGSFPPAPTDHLLWTGLLVVTFLAGLVVLLWGLASFLGWAVGGGTQSIRAVRTKIKPLPRIRVSVERTPVANPWETVPHKAIRRCHPPRLNPAEGDPPTAFPQDLRDYCAKRSVLLEKGRALRLDLKNVRIEASDAESAPYVTRRNTWIGTVQRHRHEWWPNEPLIPLSFRERDRRPPYWREKCLADIEPWIRFLEAIATDCDQSISPAISSQVHT